MDEDDARQLQRHLWALMRRTRQATPPVEGVSGTAARVLIAIARHRDTGGTTPGHIAEHLVMASSNVAAALRELDQAGYIERRRSEHDGRRVDIVLTPLGDQTLAARHALRATALRDVIDHTLTPDEQTQLAAAIPLLGKIAAAPPTLGGSAA